MKHPKHFLFLFLVALSLSFLVSNLSAATQDQQIKVLQYNVNAGTGYSYIFGASGISELFAGVQATLNEVISSDVSGRADKIAQKIANNNPDFVSLEEADYTIAFTPLPVPLYNQLLDILAGLESRGQHYILCAVTTNIDTVPLPSGFPITSQNPAYSLVDQVGLLVRADASGKPVFELSNIKSEQHYNNLLSIPNQLGALSIKRGWVSVDATMPDQSKVRIVATHMEGFSQSVQDLQAKELIYGPIQEAKDLGYHLILTGDMNSDASKLDTNPDDAGSGPAAYNDFVQAGLKDTWTETHANNATGEVPNPGFTWPVHSQDPYVAPEFADGKATGMRARLDMIMTYGNVKTLEEFVDGNNLTDTTATGQLPSDHAGVIATLSVSASN